MFTTTCEAQSCPSSSYQGPDTCRYIPSQLLAERSKEEWVSVVQRHYASIAHFSTADARREYFCALVGLPLAFCSLHRVVAAPTSDGALHLVSLDGQGQGPAAADEMLLGVNSTGVHLFRAATLRLVHSIPYRHIRQVASNLQVCFALIPHILPCCFLHSLSSSLLCPRCWPHLPLQPQQAGKGAVMPVLAMCNLSGLDTPA
jgi:hypothetical protein